uniref:Uncharacterized protein n=1 Tax=Romanomermis culicivorax TaxID=13658 RepID=A0A915ID97_ROMCU
MNRTAALRGTTRCRTGHDAVPHGITRTRHYKSIMTISRRRLTKEDFAANNTENGQYDDTHLEMSSNLVANVDVFFRTLNQITYERVPSFEMNALISDLAQYLGLWLGFSAITFFELIPFGYYIIRAALSRKKM